jgi:4-amino-4-deoxy-L-arabinose transferase-like glycosyltransferase
MKYLRANREFVILAAIVVVSALLRLTFLHEPLDRDEGQYAAIAQNILQGGLPYQDAIEIKPPGAFYLYAVGIAVFGATSEALRVFTALYSMLSVLAVYGLASVLADRKAGIYAALLYGVYASFPLVQGSSSNTEVFLVLPLTAGVWLLLRATRDNSRLMLAAAGFCAALALVIKPQALPLVALQLVLIPWLMPGSGRLQARAGNVAAYLAPLVSCAALILGYFYFRGGLEDIFYWTVQFPRRYAQSGLDLNRLQAVLAHVFSTLLVPLLAGLPSALWLASRKRDLRDLLPLLLLLAAILAIAIPGKFYPHYFIMLLPFLAVPGGIGLGRLAQAEAPMKTGALAVLAMAVCYSFWENHKFFTEYGPETVSEQKYLVTSFVESVGVADYLRDHTKPEDYIFQWGMEPELYFLANRRCPNAYLVSITPSWSKDPQRSVLDLAESLERKKPAYVVFQAEYADYPGVNQVTEFIQKRCRAETTIGYAEIFRCTSN